MSMDLPEVPKTPAELAVAIEVLIASAHGPGVTLGDGYSLCVEAMWRAAYMAHEMVAKKLHVTGFQHDVSSLTVVGALRRIEGPYRLVDLAQALYPQYDLLAETEQFLTGVDVRTWLADKATELLAAAGAEPEFDDFVDTDGETHRVRRVDPEVEAHWRKLVAERPVEPAGVSL